MKREMTAFGLSALLVVVYSVGGEWLNPAPLTASDSYEDGVETAESKSNEPKEEKTVEKTTELKQETAVPKEPDKTNEKESDAKTVKASVVAEEAEKAKELDKEKALEEQKAKEAEAKKAEEAKALEEKKAKELEEQKAKEVAEKKAKEAEAQKEAELLAKKKAEEKAKAKEVAKVDYTVEPEITMDGWADLSDEEKRALVEHSVQYVIHSQKENDTPVEAVSTIDEFIQAVDDRRTEIDGLSDNYERLRMMGTTVAGQISIMGNRFEFTY